MSTNARTALDQALGRIGDPAGEGQRACLSVYTDEALAAAEAADRRRETGRVLGPLDGVIVTVKDLFDIKGEVTRAGSRALVTRAQPATADALVVSRLRQAGAVIVGKTNMTEFAYSGIGTNPHSGTPANPADRARVPGGSSSGAAVAVADGFCRIAIGTDTGGSTRIPAAFCGLVGFKPTAKRIPREGAYPLSFTLDSIGPIAADVAGCALADAVMAGIVPRPLAPAELGGIRLGRLRGFVLDDLDKVVGDAFERVLGRLGAANCIEVTAGALDAMVAVNARGGIAPAEAHAIHRDLLASAANEIDPNVRARLARGAEISAADYILNMRDRAVAIAQMDSLFDKYDALVLPTTPTVAPLMSDVATADGFSKWNARALRNPSVANFFDLCAISLPIQLGNSLPCGLMLCGRHGEDRKLLQIAAAIEPLLRG